jgi:hypothetical protein
MARKQGFGWMFGWGNVPSVLYITGFLKSVMSRIVQCTKFSRITG